MKTIKVKKYKWLTIFNSTRSDLKLPRQKEKRLYEIIRKIKELSKEMEDLFKKLTGVSND